MKFINRCVVTLKPKANFIAWVNQLGTETPATWAFEGGAYLFDEHESEQSLMDDISERAQTILDNEFSAWTEDQNNWPASSEPAFTTLNQLFTLHIAIASFDLGKTQLLRADIADLV